MNPEQKKSVGAPRTCSARVICLGLVLVLRLLAQPAAAQTLTMVSYTNAGSITIPSFGPASAYPSVITVPNQNGTLQKVTVTLSGIYEIQPPSIEILVAGPGESGPAVDLMYNDGNGFGATNLVLTFDDAASGPLPTSGMLTNGSYQPCGTDAGDNPPQTTNELAGFIGTVWQGDWSLYVYDTFSLSPGSISNGWSLNFYYLPAPIVFSNPGINNQGQFQATLSGPIGIPLVIEGSSDLLNWTPVATNAMATSPVLFIDTNSIVPYLFYRAVYLSSLPVPVEFINPQIVAGQFSATLTGPAGTPLEIDSSPDLKTWTPVTTNAMASSSVLFTDTNALASQLFYRAVSSP